jgi:hypothetical protein
MPTSAGTWPPACSRRPLASFLIGTACGPNPFRPTINLEDEMAKKAQKRTARSRKQDRARVTGGQDYEVKYEAKKTGRSKSGQKNWQQL